LFTIYKTIPENPVGKEKEPDFCARCGGKFSGAMEFQKGLSCFSGQNVPDGNSSLPFLKAIFDTSFMLSWPFFG